MLVTKKYNVATNVATFNEDAIEPYIFIISIFLAIL